MKYIAWFVLIIPHILQKIVIYPLSWVAVTWFSSDDKLSLKWPFGWMMTNDATLQGDSYWAIEHLGENLLSNSLRAAWLRKNGGHWLNYILLGRTITNAWLDLYRSPINGVLTDKWFLQTEDAFYARINLLLWELCLGWNLLGPDANMRCKIWLQFRKRKPRADLPT